MFVPSNLYPEDKKQTISGKIPAVTFEILGGEGRAGEIKGTYGSWFEISQALRNHSILGIQGGGYEKIDFQITFADGETYTGRLDAKHYMEPENDTDVAEHVYSELAYKGGLLTEEHFVNHHLTFEKYQLELSWIGPVKVADAAQFLEDYDIPFNSYSTLETVAEAPEYRLCIKCDREYTPLGDPKWGRCGRCQWDHDRLEAKKQKRAEELAIKEADPLFPFLNDRTQVTKKIKQLLKERSGKTWSVTGGRGTGWGWLTIEAPPKRRNEYGYMSAEDSRELTDLLGLSTLVHIQGQSVQGGEWWEYLKAARGDRAPQWEANYYIRPEHEGHILNNLSEGPKSAATLLQAYGVHANPSLTGWQLDNHLYILAKKGEIVAVGDDWRLTDA